MVPDQDLNCFKDKIDLQGRTQHMCQDLSGKCIHDNRQICRVSRVRDIRDVCQQNNTRTVCRELPVKDIRRIIAGLEGFCYLPVWISLADWTQKIIFLHEPPDLLDIHIYRGLHVQQPHMDAPCALRITTELIGLQDELEILSVCVFPGFPSGLRPDPCIVTASRYTGQFAQRQD